MVTWYLKISNKRVSHYRETFTVQPFRPLKEKVYFHMDVCMNINSPSKRHDKRLIPITLCNEINADIISVSFPNVIP